MAQISPTPDFAHDGSFPLDTNADSSPLSSIDMSFLEETESRALDAVTTTVDNASNRKRKPDESEMDDPDIEAKRYRHTPTVAHMIGEIEAYIDDHKAASARDAGATRETTLVPSSGDEHDKIASTEVITQRTSLPLSTTISPPLIPPSPPHFATVSASLSPQHIFLARIPGSAPLRPHTIAKAASWFARLLTDGNTTDVIEIHKTLGIRFYLEDELTEYQQLRSEAAARRAKRDAEKVADGLGGRMEYNAETEGEDGFDGVDGVGTEWNEQRKRSRVAATEMNRNGNANYKHVSNKATDKPSKQAGNKARDKPANKPTAPPTVTLTSTPLPTPHPNTDNRAYSLRLKHKGTKRFHGNGFYTADGTPKTPHARRKLEEKEREGAEDVVRVYE